MELKWKHTFTNSSAFTHYYNGFFVKNSNKLSFFHQSSNGCHQIDFSVNGDVLYECEYDICQQEKLPYRYQWFRFRYRNATQICLGCPTWYISPSDHTIQFSDREFDRIFLEKCISEFHFTDDPFIFGDYMIEHNRSFGYLCKSISTGEVIWKRTVQGYLYTDFVEYRGGLLFGTAGKGGKLYYINLNNGESIFEINTNGTQNFVLYEDYCYCYQMGKNAKLLKINIINGQIEAFTLPGKTCIDCPIEMIDGVIYALTFERLDQGAVNPTIYAIADADEK